MPSSHNFLSGSNIALFGLSLNRKTFAEAVGEKLQQAGFKVSRIHPSGNSGYFKDLDSMSETAEAIYIATNPGSTDKIIDQAIAHGAKKIWLQYGSYNKAILEKCKAADLDFYAGCLMMYIPDAGFIHSLHRVIHELIKGRP